MEVTKVASWLLRVLGQLVGPGVEQEAGHVAVGGFGGLFHQFPGGVVGPGPAHLRRLGALARVGEHDHRRTTPFRRRSVGMGAKARLTGGPVNRPNGPDGGTWQTQRTQNPPPARA